MAVRPRLAIATALIGAAIIAAAYFSTRPPLPTERMLEIEMRASAGSVAQLYWSPSREFSEARSTRVPLTTTSEGLQRLRFPLPPADVHWLRIDPTDAPGDILIRNVQVVDASGAVLATLNPDDFMPASQIASITRMGDVMRITTTPEATDPFLTASFSCVDRSSAVSNVTTPALWLVSAAVIALLFACTAYLGKAAFAGIPRARMWASAAWLTALFLVVFAAKLLLMSQNPMTVPYWDQWEAEGRTLYIPFNECSLSWSQMFALHNEHRIFFTRLLALDLLVLNGQWDPRLQQVVNAAMHAFTGVLTAGIFWVGGARRRLPLLVCVCAVVFALPFAWDNTLSGFQSAFYFLLLFSVLAIWLTTRHRAGSLPWLLGWVCAAAALFTSAGGLITTLAILGVAALTFAGDRHAWRSCAGDAMFGIPILWLAITMASPPIPGHDFLRAHTAAEFMGALANNLSWPWLGRPALAVIVWMPVCLWLLSVAWRRFALRDGDALVAGLSAWVALNAAAIAYGRGVGAALPAGRYMDFLSLGVIANAMALVALFDLAPARPVVKRVAAAGIAVWLVFALYGVRSVTERTLVDLAVSRRHFAAHEINVRHYVITRDFTRLATKRGPNQIPYPEPYGLASALQDPYIRRILPAAVRPPLHVEPRAADTTGFLTEGRSTRGVPRDPLQRQWLSLADGRSGRGRFTSEHLMCQVGGRLRFQVAGYLGWEHNSLAIRNLQTDQRVEITPAHVPKEDWTEVVVDCPSDLFEIVAVDESPDSWFGLREPIEVGWGSLAAEWLISIPSAF